MTTVPLHQQDPMARSAEARIEAITPEGGLLCDRSVFYPKGGGQPGDSGWLRWSEGEIAIADTVKGENGAIILQPAEGEPTPAPGTAVVQTLDWPRRLAHMRVHTALHLLSVVLPLPVTGGQIGAGRGRLDFDMPEAPEDKEALGAALNALIARDLPVLESWITDAELAARPEMVKTMSVKPPSGQGYVRLIGIGEGADQVDLQPCGGTHVPRTGQIGAVRIAKIEKKGRQNRRVTIELDA